DRATGPLLRPVVDGVAAGGEDMDPPLRVQQRGQPVLDLGAAEPLPGTPAAARVPYAGGQALVRGPYEEMDPAVGGGDRRRAADPAAVFGAGLGRAESGPGAERAVRAALFQYHDLAQVGRALAAQRREPQAEQHLTARA